MAAPKRIALVTGAGSGIGRQITLALLREGYGVALAGRRQDALEETVKLAGDDGANALVVATDVTDAVSVKQLFASIAKAVGVPAKPNYGPFRAGDVQANYLSYAKAKRELGWAPKVSLDEGIANTVKFFRSGAKR